MTKCSHHQPCRALIVEDEVLIALGLEAELEGLGFSGCDIASNARDAILLAQKAKPDLLVMDIYLNGVRDGIEAARAIRQLYEVPVVFITAFGDDDGLLERVKQQVPNAPVLSKPLYGHRLADAIARAA